jgi:hypothetical protein
MTLVGRPALGQAKEREMNSVRMLGWVTVVLLMFASTGQSQEQLFVAGGAQGVQLFGSGDGGNSFDLGYGYCAEVGGAINSFSAVIGFNSSNLINRVKSSEAHATLGMPFYTELRYDCNAASPFVYVLLGLDFGHLHFEHTDGSMKLGLITFGVGSRIMMGRVFIQPKLKTFLVARLFGTGLGDMLGQSAGVMAQVQIGFVLSRSDQ